MNRLLSFLGLLLVPAVLPAADDSLGRALFRNQTGPILASKCIGCHGPDKKRGGLDLTRRNSALKGGKHGAALKPGDARDSLLFQRINAHEMPPKNPLSAQQLQSLKQ